METKRAVSALFGEVEEEEITQISELPGISEAIVKVLSNNKLEALEDLVALDEAALAAMEGLTPEDAKAIMKVIAENIEIVEEEEKQATFPAEAEGEFPEDSPAAEENDDRGDEQDEEVGEAIDEDEESYNCPECGASITVDMASCPDCGVGFSFEDEDEDEDEDGDEADE